MFSIRIFFIILALVFGWQHSEGAELPENYVSVRAMGMGNAFTAVVDNEEALMYNPAALCRISGFNLNLINPTVGAEGAALVDDVRTLVDAKTPTATAAALQNFFGRRAGVYFSLLPVVSVPCLAAGAVSNIQFSTTLNNPAYPNLRIRAIGDAGAAVGAAIPIIPKVFYLGVTPRFLYRYGTDLPLGMSTIATLSTTELRNNIANLGYGFAADMGGIVTIPGPVSPTLGIAWRNIGYSEFTKTSGLSAPPRLQQEMAIGASITLDAYIIKIIPSAEVKHLEAAGVQLGKKLHAGMEIQLPIVSVRGGLHQGYYTLGAGVDLGLLRVDAATWGVEMGEYPGQDESRRYAVQAAVNLSFDADFGFNWKLNMRRKVKQRR
jgi:hypothetical protein